MMQQWEITWNKILKMFFPFNKKYFMKSVIIFFLNIDYLNFPSSNSNEKCTHFSAIDHELS